MIMTMINDSDDDRGKRGIPVCPEDPVVML
jgi:hypothetical protein